MLNNRGHHGLQRRRKTACLGLGSSRSPSAPLHLMKKCLLLSALCFWSVSSYGQVSLATSVYSQNFDTLDASNINVAWSNNSTLPGWYLINSLGNAVPTYNAGNGGTNTGAFYSFGAASASDRALGGAASGGTYFGSPGSGAVAGYIAVGFTNDTGMQITSIGLSFDGEQWRNGGNTSPQTMVMEYGFGSTFAGVATWNVAGAGFNFVSPIASGTAAAVDGNTAGQVTDLGGTISATWLVGETLWIRWIERNDAGNDHGLAIDNFSMTVAGAAIPEPSTYAAILGLLAAGGVLRHRRRRC